MIHLVGFILAVYGFAMLFMNDASMTAIGLVAYVVGCYEMFVYPMEPLEWEEE